MKPPFPFYHQGAVAKMFGITRQQAGELANNPLEAVRVPDGSGSEVWAFNCIDVDKCLTLNETHEFVSDDDLYCVHCGGYPFDLLHWTI